MTSQPPARKPVVFLDRDGTINVEVGFVTSPSQLVLIPGAAAAIRRLNEAGIPTALLTNQSAIGRGMIDEARFGEIQAELDRALAAEGAKLDLVRFCPHHPTEARPPYRIVCRCRKPATGLIEDASAELGADPERSFMVGDDLRDLAIAIAPVTPILVRTGKGTSVEPEARVRHGSRLVVVDALPQAIDHVLETLTRV